MVRQRLFSPGGGPRQQALQEDLQADLTDHRDLTRLQGWANLPISRYCETVTTRGYRSRASYGACLRLVTGTVVLATTLAFVRPALADDPAVGKITLLNRKAVEAYQHLEFETAERLLNEALDQSERAGLTQHPIRARTFVTLGIVALGGLKQREKAVKYFRKALQIQPEVRLNPGLANPEIQTAFDDAIAGLGSGEDLPPEKALVHEPVRVGQSKQPVPISVVPDKDLEASSLVLRYRAATSASFADMAMKKGATGAFEAAIPASATDGEQVAYFIEARRRNGSVVVGRGTAADPIVVALARPTEVVATAFVVFARASSDKRIFFAIAGGTGLGYSSGDGEATRNPVTSAGVGWTHSGQLSPELGSCFSDRLMFGVQMRLQLVRGANEYHLPSAASGECGDDGVCSPASGAIAALLKLTWFLTDTSSVFQPYLSLSAGAGTIRNVASVKAPTTCGTGSQACMDTIPGGPVLVGPGFGFRLVVSDGVGIVAGVNGLVGVPKAAATADVNIGVAFQL
jgi:tetratricopeptide (TPR) repeat protein